VGLESSKGDLDGSKVAGAYFNGELERIKDYCEMDVKVSIDLAGLLIDLLP
jgi:predicted PolB exonuclease-like 3'-5' exonuclease